MPNDIQCVVVVRVPVLQRFDRTNFHRPRPWIQIVQAKKYRNEQHKHQRHGDGSGFQETAGGITPAAASELVNHGHGKAPQRKSQPEENREQVGKIELRGIRECAECARDERCQADQE